MSKKPEAPNRFIRCVQVQKYLVVPRARDRDVLMRAGIGFSCFYAAHTSIVNSLLAGKRYVLAEPISWSVAQQKISEHLTTKYPGLLFRSGKMLIENPDKEELAEQVYDIREYLSHFSLRTDVSFRERVRDKATKQLIKVKQQDRLKKGLAYSTPACVIEFAFDPEQEIMCQQPKATQAVHLNWGAVLLSLERMTKQAGLSAEPVHMRVCTAVKDQKGNTCEGEVHSASDALLSGDLKKEIQRFALSLLATFK